MSKSEQKLEDIMRSRTGIGQDSHRFLESEKKKPCIIGGVEFEETPGFDANSDGDVLFHAICNAISTLSGIPILGALADKLCLQQGITDSEVYLTEALKTLGNQKIVHVAITLEGKKPKFKDRIREMRDNIARVLGINTTQVGIMATTGEELTSFGRGEGVQCFCIVTTEEP
jgi:2-C-methyl-D-erythritol 2,4-cyclodiphosphate synthase